MTPFATPEPFVRSSTLKWRFPEHVGPWTLIGTSRASDATSFFIPELSWTLDAGALIHTHRPERVFITHTHTDHVHFLTHIKTRRKPPHVYLPGEAESLVESYFEAAQDLTDGARLPEGQTRTKAYELVGVEAGDRVVFGRGKEQFGVDVVACDHTVTCVGYVFCEIRTKLKAEHAGLKGPEIAALRRSGVEVSEAVDRPLFAFMGDTTVKVYEDHPEILSAPVVIAECSFLREEHLEQGRKTRHTSWKNLRPIIEAHPETLFVLTHFSMRYRDAEIAAFFADIGAPNILPWVSAGAA